MNTPTKKNTYFENYDLYSDANPSSTIRVKYNNIENLNKTISKLERLYKKNTITHSRNSKIVNVMVQRLRVIKDNTGKGKDRLKRITDYFNHLKQRTKIKGDSKRKKYIFK